MCGIIGYISLQNICNYILLNGLNQLQNRGYDSAGISSMDLCGNIITTKYASTGSEDSIEKLEKNIDEHQNYMGIGHTRWATHGGKTDENSHPHNCMNNMFSVVHNGIIENYSSIKTKLIKKNFIFKSQTDTEVISNLLLYNCLINKDKSIEEIIQITCKELEGTWGLVIMCYLTPNKLYTTRKGSPIIISHDEKEAYIVSEQSAFCGKSKEYFVLKNNDIITIEIKDGKINTKSFTNLNSELSQKNKINIVTNELTYKPYSSWLEKEIYEQSDSSLRAISLGGRLLSNKSVKLGGLESYNEVLTCVDNIIFLGCGTSYHAGLLGVNYFKKNCNFNLVQCIDGAEFEISDIPKFGKTAIVLLSQSGETRDLYRCIEIGRKNKCTLIGVINVVDSQIARKVNCGVYLNAGREVSVASTKSFTSQCIILLLMSIWFSQLQGKTCDSILFDNIRNFSYNLYDFFQKNDEIKKISFWAEYFSKCNNCFLIGKGDSIPVIYEGALKIKEVTYIHAEAYSASSLKHGPLALICDDFPIILYIPDDENVSKMISAYEELHARGGKIFCISNSIQFFEYLLDRPEYDNNYLISVNFETNIINLIMNICTQLLALKISIIKNINPDKPRNLAKVVTVE
jgi:glutamine---fructose-6-phosphate transaminase (isomerizing)